MLINEKEIVESLKKGDFEAFDRLFLYYNQRLYYFAKSILKSHEDAKDNVQEVFFRIWKNRSLIDTKASFKSYLFTISYNIIVDTMRKRVCEDKFRDKLIKNAVIEKTTVNEELEFKELSIACKEAISELPPKRKEIFEMHRLENKSYQEIADNLDISISTVRNQMTKAIGYLREKLGKDSFLCILFNNLFI